MLLGQYYKSVYTEVLFLFEFLNKGSNENLTVSRQPNLAKGARIA